MLPNFTYVRAKSLVEAVRLLTAPGTRAHAGGTDLLGCLRDEVFTTERVVSLGALKELRGISETPAGGVRIGALATIAEVAAHRTLRERYAVLAQAAASVASPQLRNQGTIGGNICQRPRCWYFRGGFECLRKGGDTCFAIGGENQYHALFDGAGCCMVHPSDIAPALVALDARVRIAGPGGASRTLPIGAFFVGPAQAVKKEHVLERNQLVTEILLPPAQPGMRSVYRKVRARGSWDFALASLALSLVVTDGTVRHARIVLGAAAPIPWRAQAAEQAILGRRLTAEAVSATAEAAMKGAEPLEKNAYKIPMFKGLIAEVLPALA